MARTRRLRQSPRKIPRVVTEYQAHLVERIRKCVIPEGQKVEPDYLSPRIRLSWLRREIKGVEIMQDGFLNVL